MVGVQILATGVNYPGGYDIVFDGNITDGTLLNPETVDIVSRQYRKQEVDVLLAAKSNVISPTFTTKIVTPICESASLLELKATGSNAIKFYTNSLERARLSSAGNLQFSTGLGLNLTKPTQTAINWTGHQQLIEVTINAVRSASIPVYSSFNMSGLQRFFLEVTSDVITSGSLVVVHTYSPNGYTDWFPEMKNLRSMYVSGSSGKFRITGVVAGTHGMFGNSTTNLYVNYTIM